MSIELKLELGHRASLRTEPAADGFTHDWMIFVRGTKGCNISRIVDRVVFHLHDSHYDPNNPAEEPKPLRVSKSGYSCLLMPIDIYFRNKWKSSRVRLEYELVFPLGESPVYNICHEKLVFMNPPEEFHHCLMEAGGVIVREETIEPLRIENYHYHDLHPQGQPHHLPFQAKQIICKRVCRETVESACKDTVESVCRDTVESVCRDTVESVCRNTVESVCKDTVESICRDTVESICSETGGSASSSELSIHGKCNPIRLNKSCGIPYDLHSHPQQPHDVKETSKASSLPPDVKETSKGTASNDAVTVCGPKNIKVKLELGHRASIRDHPTREGSTHDWMVFVRGIEGCNISHFVEKVVFHLHESFPNRKRVVKKPPYQVTESGYGGFLMPIEVFFRNDEEPRKVRFEYDLFVRLKGPPILNIHREKLLFKNPTDDFRRRLLKARGDWCRDHDKCFETAPHVSRSLLRQFQEIEEAEKSAAVNSDYHKEDKKVHPKEFIMDSGPICQAENVVLSLDFTHESSMLEKPLPDGSTHSWTMEMRGFKDADISLFVDKVVFHLHESCPYPTRVVKDPPYQASEYGFASFAMAIDVYLRSEEEPKKLRFHHDVYLRVDPFPVSMVSQEKVVFQNPFPDLRDRLLKAGGVLVYSKCSVHHQQPKDQAHPPPSEDILQHSHGDLALPYHDPAIDELEAIQEALVRKKCPVHHEDENCDTTLCATLLQHIHELEEAERANGNSNGRPIETEPFMYLGSQRVDKKRNASIACFLMAKNAEQEDIQNKKLRIAPHSTCSDLNSCGAYGAFEDEDSNECCAALPGIAPAADIVDLECMLCAQMKRDILFYPCGHIALCSMCSTSVKECIICEEPVELGIKIGDCVVCSDKRASVIFEPCAHVCACDGCASLMKNCIQCQEQIEDTIPVTECCVPDGFDQPDLRTPSPSFSDASTIEEIVLDTHFPENSNTDIEKLQQELQDIKEQTMCPVCLDRLKNVIFMCGHGTCRICSKPITKCPICRKPVKKHIVLY